MGMRPVQQHRTTMYVTQTDDVYKAKLNIVKVRTPQQQHHEHENTRQNLKFSQQRS